MSTRAKRNTHQYTGKSDLCIYYGEQRYVQSQLTFLEKSQPNHNPLGLPRKKQLHSIKQWQLIELFHMEIVRRRMHFTGFKLQRFCENRILVNAINAQLLDAFRRKRLLTQSNVYGCIGWLLPERTQGKCIWMHRPMWMFTFLVCCIGFARRRLKSHGNLQVAAD